MRDGPDVHPAPAGLLMRWWAYNRLLGGAIVTGRAQAALANTFRAAALLEPMPLAVFMALGPWLLYWPFRWALLVLIVTAARTYPGRLDEFLA